MFETIRPSMPKVVYIGGDQCEPPKPLTGEMKEFVESSIEYEGLIVFSLGGVLNTEVLPRTFFRIFLDIFRDLPTYRVVWKLKSLPEEFKDEFPSNVKVV